jgi:hypothetical protein
MSSKYEEALKIEDDFLVFIDQVKEKNAKKSEKKTKKGPAAPIKQVSIF